MDLANLLVLVPPALAVGWLVHLLFRKELATQSLGKIISYFIGVAIIFWAIALLVDRVFVPWFNSRLITARNSAQLEESINIIEDVFDDSFTSGGGVLVVPTSAPTPIIVSTPVPTTPGGAAAPTGSNSGEWPKQHVVQPGEALITIGAQYGVSWEAIQEANGLKDWTIYPGQTLLIPAPSK